MLKKISLGSDIFDKLIENDGYYVDKTEIIYELVEETVNEVTLFTRPRRFGKSLTMSMMESFFDIRHVGNRAFEGLNILKNHPDFCEKWMHQYPTVLISLKDVEGTSFEGAYSMLEGVISELCIKYSFLETDSKVDPADAAAFHRLKFKEAGKNKKKAEERVEEIKNSLKTIMRMMYAVYGKPVILLIDEYDVPLARAYENCYYKEMLDVIDYKCWYFKEAQRVGDPDFYKKLPPEKQPAQLKEFYEKVRDFRSGSAAVSHPNSNE